MMTNDGIKIVFYKLTGQKIDSEEIYSQRCKILNISENAETIDICFNPKKMQCPYELVTNLKQFYTVEFKDITIKITFLNVFDREIQSIFLDWCDVISIPSGAAKVALCFTDKYEKNHRCFSQSNA